MPREIGFVLGDESGGGGADRVREFVEPPGLGRRHDERIVLGADRVVGRHHAGAGIALELGAVDIVEHLGPAAELHDEAQMGALDLLVLARAGAAQDGRDRGDGREARRQRPRDEDDVAPAREPLLGQRHHLDHALVGLPRALAESEDAVLQEDEPLDRGIGLVDLGRLLGEREAGRDVGHEPHAPPIKLDAARFAVGLVGDAQHRGRVRVIDIGVRQEGVQQGLDRRIGRHRIEQIGALHPHHVFVRERIEPPQAAQRPEPHGGKARRLDLRHVPAAALDAQHLGLLAHQVGEPRLERGVAAAMKDEPLLPPEQARGVDAKGEVAADAGFRIARGHLFGRAVAPFAFHAAYNSR